MSLQTGKSCFQTEFQNISTFLVVRHHTTVITHIHSGFCSARFKYCSCFAKVDLRIYERVVKQEFVCTKKWNNLVSERKCCLNGALLCKTACMMMAWHGRELCLKSAATMLLCASEQVGTKVLFSLKVLWKGRLCECWWLVSYSNNNRFQTFSPMPRHHQSSFSYTTRHILFKRCSDVIALHFCIFPSLIC